MSSLTPTSSPSTPTPSSTPTTDPSYPDDQPINTNSPTQYYNYLFLLLAASIIALFLLLIYYLRRRRQNSLARRQQRGRAALIRDVARFPSHPGGHHGSSSSSHAPFFWTHQRPSSLYSLDEEEEQQQQQRGSRNLRGGDAVLEPGLDERGEAPPPYGATAATAATSSTRIIDSSKAGFVPPREPRAMRSGDWLAGGRQQQRRWYGGLSGESRVSDGQLDPPGYDWRSREPQEGVGIGMGMLPVRPAEVVTVVERPVVDEEGGDGNGNSNSNDRSAPRNPRRTARPWRVFAT